MGRSYFLDKDGIIDKNGDIYFTISNVNGPGFVYAYRKYVFTGNGLWKGYERVLRNYGVHNLVKSQQKFMFDPCQNVDFPTIMTSDIRKHLLPEQAFRHLLTNERKSFLTDYLLGLLEPVTNSRLGVTGSLLLGIEHKNSDIDILVYGCKRAEDFLTEFRGGEPDKDWLRETSINYSLEEDLVKDLYDSRIRGIFKGIKYSVHFVDETPRRYCMDVCTQKGDIRLQGEIEGECQALFYPARAKFNSHEEYELISWEGIFSSSMYGRRKAEVRGIELACSGKRVIIIGDRNVQGYIKVLH
ncbi:hypothetical protein GWK48_06095 [Metallosphaera tengchongensis]|uniref:Polymerase nucleotidyl transferase domain-containing protein n=1 Tax=Metallosphaera tengchongensis TaxID=1532350 RepID=A0A6N0NV00_9CREN|nr:nucleotidyltransferase domain-containing protein [Metallosphaera tengchongensis]QKR00005.1 hypothetical protein GWK48_06095 [Metallosphaera tengchongensis]